MTIVGLSQSPPWQRRGVRKITLENRQKETLLIPLFPSLYLTFFFMLTKPYSQNSLYILINNIFAIRGEIEQTGIVGITCTLFSFFLFWENATYKTPCPSALFIMNFCLTTTVYEHVK